MNKQNLYVLFGTQLRTLAEEYGYHLSIQHSFNLNLRIVAMPLLSTQNPNKDEFLNKIKSLVNGKTKSPCPKDLDALIITPNKQRIEINFVR
jgi:hypothetical protein